ncbi:alpha/beta fold hydrolase [bacterium]|nr:alpha/beta fold hydrolase [bacterium]
MKEKEVWFFSDGIKLNGTFYYPSEVKTQEKNPIVMTCSGFLGLNAIHPARFARALTQKGYICFGFDYRGFAKSGGERRRVLLQEQIRDIENAALYLSLQKEMKGRNLVLIGWGMGAGLILQAADEIPQLAGLICINGFYNGYRFLKERRTEGQWKEFMNWLHKLRKEEVQTGEIKRVDPFKIYPLDEVTQKYVNDVLFKTKGFGGKVELHFGYSLLHYNPEAQLNHLPPLPLLVVHGEKNKLHPLSEANSLYEKYPGPKELFIIPHAGHTEWMCDDCDPFQNLIQRILQWIDQKIKK